MAVINWQITKTVTIPDSRGKFWRIMRKGLWITLYCCCYSIFTTHLPIKNFWVEVKLKYFSCWYEVIFLSECAWLWILWTLLFNSIEEDGTFSLKLLFGSGNTGGFCSGSQRKYFNKPATVCLQLIILTGTKNLVFKGKILIGLILTTQLQFSKFANILLHQHFITYGIIYVILLL